MKSFNTYILEQSLDIDQLILEKSEFWAKVKKFFGFDDEKVSNTMSKWDDNLKNSFTTTQYIGAKSKDKEVKKDVEELSKAAEGGTKELYKATFNKVEYYIKSIKKASDNMLMIFINNYQLLRDLSEELKNDEGKQLAKKFKGLIDEKWPDGEEKYEKEYNKVKKSSAPEGPQDEKTNQKDEDANKEVKKEIKNETSETIKDNKDLLVPLAKEAGVDGNTLRNFVGTKLRKTLGEDQEKIRKKGTREAVQKALGEPVILGTCIMVLGALITKDDNKIQEICKQIGSSSEELMNKLKNYK